MKTLNQVTDGNRILRQQAENRARWKAGNGTDQDTGAAEGSMEPPPRPGQSKEPAESQKWEEVEYDYYNFSSLWDPK